LNRDYELELLSRIEKLQKDNAMLVEALELYADKEHWENEIYGYDKGSYLANDDRGAFARETLAKVGMK